MFSFDVVLPLTKRIGAKVRERLESNVPGLKEKVGDVLVPALLAELQHEFRRVRALGSA